MKLLLVDSDVSILLAASGLFDPLIEHLGFRVSDVRRLDPLPYMLKRGRLARTYPEQLREKVIAWCSRIAPAQEAARDLRVQQLLVRDAIDPGEAGLLAQVYEHPERYLATGDKRSLLALAKHEDLAEIRLRLAGRILCFETILETLVDHAGTVAIARAFTPLRPYNSVLRVVFSRGEETSEESFRQALASYFAELERRLGPGFFWIPGQRKHGEGRVQLPTKPR
ncbi:MAG: hypothetical protein HC897_11700 [Thermoanaerobaculia bacterium]|nr:hypothetical protein [Thermoanaerobaculia bacterium]